MTIGQRNGRSTVGVNDRETVDQCVRAANDGEAIRNIGNAELKGVQRGVDQPLQFQPQRSLRVVEQYAMAKDDDIKHGLDDNKESGVAIA